MLAEKVIDCFMYGSLFIMLLFCAFRDWREGIIPNRYLIRGIEIRIFLLLPEVWLSGFDSILQLFNKAGISILILLSGILIRKMTRNGIGMGDIKLLAVMFLFLPAVVWMTSVMFASVIGLLIGIVFGGEKGKRERIPFAPAIFAGTMIGIGLSL